jgi:enoyl-CoA hydratase
MPKVQMNEIRKDASSHAQPVRELACVPSDPQQRTPSDWASFGVAVSDGVAEVTLTGQASGNLLGLEFWHELPQLFDKLDRDPLVRAVLLAANGPHFSYGIDLKAMRAIFGDAFTTGGLAAPRSELRAAITQVQAAISSVADCTKPVIAAVHGWCIGAALDLISATDIRYASADARFSVREVRVGIVADLGSLQRLPAIIGEGNTRELALTGDDIDAERARIIGLVNGVLGDRHALVAQARTTAHRIAQNAPLVVQGVKHVLDRARRPSINDGLDYVATWNAAFLPSADLTEAIAAVFEKRTPQFGGK